MISSSFDGTMPLCFSEMILAVSLMYLAFLLWNPTAAIQEFKSASDVLRIISIERSLSYTKCFMVAEVTSSLVWLESMRPTRVWKACSLAVAFLSLTVWAPIVSTAAGFSLRISMINGHYSRQCLGAHPFLNPLVTRDLALSMGTLDSFRSSDSYSILTGDVLVVRLFWEKLLLVCISLWRI